MIADGVSIAIGNGREEFGTVETVSVGVGDHIAALDLRREALAEVAQEICRGEGVDARRDDGCIAEPRTSKIHQVIRVEGEPGTRDQLG